jgi:ATP-dependent DNA ligase
MKTKHDLENPIVQRIKKWKSDQGIISLTLESLLEKVAEKPCIIEQKVDGQSSLLNYEQGSEPVFGSLGGVLYWDLPVLEEAAKILKAADVKAIEIVGEMAGYRDGKIIPFNETEHIIKNPDTDKTLVHWFPYQIVKINGEEIDDDFETYKKYWKQLKKFFDGAKYIHPVKDYSGGIQEIKQAWDKLVLKDKNEGIVVRTDDNKVYKAKPIFTYDLVIVAVGSKKGKNWPHGKIGMMQMAFMDSNKIFRTAGNMGTGWSDKQSAEIYQWAMKNKVGEDDTYIWVKPERIVEVRWERTTIKDMPAYSFKNGRYVPEGKKKSGTIVKPRFIRYREDKVVDPHDLRLTQIPDWNIKMAHKIANRYAKYVVEKNKQGIPIMYWITPSGKKMLVRDAKKMNEPPIGTIDERDPNGRGLIIFTPDGRKVFDLSEREEFEQEKRNVQKWLKEHA